MQNSIDTLRRNREELMRHSKAVALQSEKLIRESRRSIQTAKALLSGCRQIPHATVGTGPFSWFEGYDWPLRSTTADTGEEQAGEQKANLLPCSGAPLLRLDAGKIPPQDPIQNCGCGKSVRRRPATG